MAGLRGNTATIIAAKQAAKGTAATLAPASAIRAPFSGGNLGPVRTFGQLAETDSNRDQGTSYVITGGVEGAPENYVRDRPISFWLGAALGTDTVSGTTPKIHTITPANNIPYLTIVRSIADTLWEQYTDCFVNTLRIHAGAGQPLEAVISIQGRASTRLTVDPNIAAALPLESGYVYNYNDAAVTLAGGATALVGSFDLSIDNNVTRQQTDDVVPYDVVAGQRQVNLSFDLIFETLTEYNKFHYGSSSGTATSSTIYTTSAVFDFVPGGIPPGVFASANNAIEFSLPSIAYEEFPVAPDASGAPIVASIRAVAQRGASPVVTAVVKNADPAWAAT